MIEYLLFEGCTIGNRLPFIEAASRKVFEKFGIHVSQAPFSCCPDITGIRCFDNNAWLVLGARNICLAEEREKDIMTLCNGCVNTLRGVDYQLKNDSMKKERVNNELAEIRKNYEGSIEIKHFVDVFKNEIGINKIKTFITKKLHGLKVACHPGCHYMRPVEWMKSDDPLNPKNLKNLVSATKATIVDYKKEEYCCGSSITNSHGYEEYGLSILKNKMDSIMNGDADVICVHCPSCFQQFDTKQRLLSKKFKQNYNIPVLYLTELYALAIGFSPDEIGLKFHRIRLNNILENYDL